MLQLKGLKCFPSSAVAIISLVPSSVCDAEALIRYLTAIDSFYYDGLSDASKKSLELQGGPFKGEELLAFKSDPLKEDMVRLREWSDMSKIIGIVEKTPRADAYEP